MTIASLEWWKVISCSTLSLAQPSCSSSRWTTSSPSSSLSGHHHHHHHHHQDTSIIIIDHHHQDTIIIITIIIITRSPSSSSSGHHHHNVGDHQNFQVNNSSDVCRHVLQIHIYVSWLSLGSDCSVKYQHWVFGRIDVDRYINTQNYLAMYLVDFVCLMKIRSRTIDRLGIY